MTVRELNVGDVFRMAGKKHKQLWRKVSPTHGRRVGARFRFERRDLRTFGDREIELVERAADIGRAEGTLILKGGAVTLEFKGPLLVHRCTPGDPFTEFVMLGDSLSASLAQRPSEDTALAFVIVTGAKHLNRSKGSDLLAYRGRVYARATTREVRGTAARNYNVVRKIDGSPRMVLAGVLTLPEEFALYDIIMEHFGPDTVAK